MSSTVLPPSGPAPEPPGNLLGRVDRWQREHAPTAFPVAVWKKFGDDNGGKLAAQLTYYGFLSLFPLLLVTVTILGYVLDGRPDLQESIMDSAVAQFPIIGDQLNQNVASLEGNVWGLVIGVGTALWGGLGVTQAARTSWPPSGTCPGGSVPLSCPACCAARFCSSSWPPPS